VTRARAAALAAALLVAAAYGAVSRELFRGATRLGYFDTRAYRQVAARPLGDPRFWSGERPFTVPLLLKLGDERVTEIQGMAYAVGWLLLAAVVLTLFRRRWLGALTACFLLFLSLCTDIFYWNQSLSSESVSNSLFLILLALAILYFRAQRRGVRIALGVAIAPVVLLWAFARDANAYWLVAAGLPTLALTLLVPSARRFRRDAALGLCAAVALAALVGTNAQRAGRWKIPLVNILGKRVLPDWRQRAWWTARGMPLNDKVRCFEGRYSHDCRDDYSGFGDWLRQDQRGLYARYLLSRPVETLTAPARDCRTLLCAYLRGFKRESTLTFYFKIDPPEWQKWANRAFFYRCRYLVIPAGLALGLFALVLALRRWDRRLLLPLVLTASVFPYALFLWHADAMEPQRHAVLLLIIVRLGLWLLAALAADVLLRAREQ
jgi:hypothetical protein